MKKVRLFMENFLIYGFGGVISKIIPLIMLPIISRILPDSSYFGINDNATTLVSIASYFALLGMYDAMYRMFFDKDDERFRRQVCSTTFFFVFSWSLIIFALMFLLRERISELFFETKELGYVVLITAFTMLVGSTNTIVSGPSRMQNKRFIYVLMNAVGPILSYSLALILLNKKYYIIALPLASLLSVVINELVFLALNHKWFSLKAFDFKLLCQMLKFAIPLVPNFLIYWIFNSCDRLMITQILGLEHAGLYGIGSKLGSASQLIYTAFAGGWQYFAFSTMKDKNQVQDNSKLFEYLAIVSFSATIFICVISYILYDWLFPETYIASYVIAPYLFLAPLLQMLFQVAVAQFAIIKKTWPNMIILLLGAIINVILNIVMIPRLGIEGAAIATLIGYAISVIICVVVLTKMKLLDIRKKFWGVTMFMVLFFVAWRCFFSTSVLIAVVVAFVMYAIFGIIYREDLQVFFIMLLRRREKSKKTLVDENRKE